MSRARVTILATAFGLIGLLTSRPLLHHGLAQPTPSATPAQSGDGQSSSSPSAKAAGVDRYGDPLPAGAIARLGTTRLRHGHNVMAVVFSPDGKSLASVGHDHSIRLWETVSGKEQRAFGDPQIRADAYSPLRWGFCVAFSPDGKTLASGDFAAGWPVKTIHIWDVATGKERLTLQGHQQGILSVAFSPDGKTLASASVDQTIRLWDTSALVPQADGSIRAGKELRQITGHQQVVNRVIFSPDGKLLASAGADHTVRLWDPDSGKESRVIEKQLGGVESIAFSPDGKVLASVGADKIVRFWDPNTGKQTRELKGSKGRVSCIAFSGDGKRLACGGDGCDVYDLADTKDRPGFGFTAGAVHFVALSRDGKTLATVDENANMIRLWDVTTAKKIGPQGAHTSWVGYLTFSPNGKTIISAARDGTVRRWETATGKELGRIETGQEKSRQAAVSPDGKIMAVGNAKGAIVLREAGSGKEIGKLEGIKGAVQCVAFSVDGKRLAAGGADKRIHIWDLATNKHVQELGEHSAGVARVVFSPDGKTVASAGGDSVIHLWELANRVELQQLAEHQGTADSMAFSPDGKLLATGSHQDGSARIWDPASGNLLRHIPGHPGYVQAVLFSPDGHTLAVGSWRSVRLHEVATGVERGRLLGHEGDVAALAFSPDGRSLASSGGDTTVLVWDLTGQAADSSPERLAKAWADLAGEDGGKAYRAIWTLVAARADAVALLHKQLQPQAPADPKRIAKWIADLDNDEFTVRNKAAAELEKLGDLAEPALRKALEDMPSPEVSQRVNQLLAKLHGQATSGTWVQRLRAVEVLEQIGSAEAKQVLEIVQKGPPEARLTQEAKAALARLAARTPPPP